MMFVGKHDGFWWVFRGLWIIVCCLANFRMIFVRLKWLNTLEHLCYAVFADWYRWCPCWFLIVWTARNRPHVFDSNQRFNLQTCGLGFGCWMILFVSSWSSTDLGKLKEFWLNCWTVEPRKKNVFWMIFQWFIWICSRQKGLAVDD